MLFGENVTSIAMKTNRMKYCQKDNRTNQLQIFLAETLINRKPCLHFSRQPHMWYFLLLLQNMPDILNQPCDTVGPILPTHGTIWGCLSSSGGVRQHYSFSFAASLIFVHLRRHLFREVRPYTVGQGILSTVTPKRDQMSIVFAASREKYYSSYTAV